MTVNPIVSRPLSESQDKRALEYAYFVQFSSFDCLNDEPPQVGDIAELNGLCTGHCRSTVFEPPTALHPGERVEILRLYVGIRSSQPFAQIKFNQGQVDNIPAAWLDVVERGNGG